MICHHASLIDDLLSIDLGLNRDEVLLERHIAEAVTGRSLLSSPPSLRKKPPVPSVQGVGTDGDTERGGGRLANVYRWVGIEGGLEELGTDRADGLRLAGLDVGLFDAVV